MCNRGLPSIRWDKSFERISDMQLRLKPMKPVALFLALGVATTVAACGPEEAAEPELEEPVEEEVVPEEPLEEEPLEEEGGEGGEG